MVKKVVTIKNKTGLHARPAYEFVKKASTYCSDIILRHKGKEINAKSIISVLTAGISMGTVVEICAEGPDEKESVEGLSELIQSNFGE